MKTAVGISAVAAVYRVHGVAMILLATKVQYKVMAQARLATAPPATNNFAFSEKVFDSLSMPQIMGECCWLVCQHIHTKIGHASQNQ